MPYLTPAELPIDIFCRQLRIPNHVTWIGTVTGALRGACFPSEWEQSEGGITPDEAAARWTQMYREYLESTCEGDYNNCRQYAANSPIIHYAPNDPFLTPDYTPDGYALPPWYHNAGVPLPGVLPNDAMVNLLSLAVIPQVILDAGLPRFSLTVSGVGEMELELVKIPQAGYLLIDAPDATTPVQLADMTSVSVTDLVSLAFILSLFGLPGDFSAVNTEVVELEFETDAVHTVTCYFVPSIGGEEILGFGGGLRSVTLCGLSLPGDDMYLRLRQNPSNPCEMQAQYEPGGDWETVYSAEDCCSDTPPVEVEKRLNPETGYWEINDGSGWVKDPSDPRVNPIVFPAPGVCDRCQASRNAFDQIVELYAAIGTIAEAGGTLVQISASIAAILIILITRPTDAYWLIPIILEAIGQVRDYELAAFVSQFATVYAEPLRKSLYCHIGEDCRYTDEGVSAIWSEMEALEFTPGGANIALPVIKIILFSLQAAGLNNASTIKINDITPGECDEFDCGGCDVENWIIRYPETGHFGEITEYNAVENYIEISSTGINTNNQYYAYIQTTDPLTQGCAIHGIQLIGGDMGSTDPSGNRAYNAIDDNNLEHFTIFPSAICVNCLQWSSATPFSIRVTFDEC